MNNKTLRLGACRGITFADHAKEAIQLAQEEETNVEFRFGKQILLAKPDSTEDSLWTEFERLNQRCKK